MAFTARRVIATLILLCISAVSFGQWVSEQPPSVAVAFPDGVMHIGVDASFPPFALDDGQSITGIDVDVGRAIAAHIGVDVQFVNMSFDGLYDALHNNQVDVVISALVINPAKTDEVLYTVPYYDNGLLLVTPPESDITYMRDLVNSRLALEFGSLADSTARYYVPHLDNVVVQPYELPAYALDAVRLSQADAALVNTTSYHLYNQGHPNWQSDGHRVSNIFYVAAVKIDRTATYERINNSMRELGERGTFESIISLWFS